MFASPVVTVTVRVLGKEWVPGAAWWREHRGPVGSVTVHAVTCGHCTRTVTCGHCHCTGTGQRAGPRRSMVAVSTEDLGLRLLLDRALRPETVAVARELLHCEGHEFHVREWYATLVQHSTVM